MMMYKDGGGKNIISNPLQIHLFRNILTSLRHWGKTSFRFQTTNWTILTQTQYSQHVKILERKDTKRRCK